MKYGLIGNPLGHSFSKEVHEMLGYEYNLKELKSDELDLFFKEKEFLGINVTIPYKEKVIPCLDYFDESARKIGSCNTIVNKDGKLCGYNTDYLGARAMIERKTTIVKKALVLGTGGTSKTFCRVLKDMGADKIYVVSRTPKENQISYEDAYENYNDCDVVVNTTPVGMFPNVEKSPLDLQNFKNLSLVVDAVYNPLKTELVIQAEKLGINSCGGLYMLIAQAVYASELFGKNKAEKSLIEKIYNNILNKKRNVVLIGMPGSGKTTIASKLDKNYIDTDIEINNKYKISPCDMIKEYGEKYFRDKESEVIKNFSGVCSKVIATGGGAVLKEENVKELKRNGILIYIDVPLEKLKPTDDRPLSSSQSMLEKMYFERNEIYKSVSDLRIESNYNADDTTKKIKEALNDENTCY